MIIRTPSAGNWTDWLMRSYDSVSTINPTLLEENNTRASAVLGPDGNPIILERKKQKIGFDLKLNG